MVTTGGLIIDTRARLGCTAPIGSTDDTRLRHLTAALPPQYAARLFDAQQQIAAKVLGEVRTVGGTAAPAGAVVGAGRVGAPTGRGWVRSSAGVVGAYGCRGQGRGWGGGPPVRRRGGRSGGRLRQRRLWRGAVWSAGWSSVGLFSSCAYASRSGGRGSVLPHPRR